MSEWDETATKEEPEEDIYSSVKSEHMEGEEAFEVRFLYCVRKFGTCGESKDFAFVC